MIRYGKSTQNAIAAMSRLAVGYGQDERLSSGDIARDRDLPQTLVAKLLTNLSQAGLVTGSPGPGGGYALAKHPEQMNDQFEAFLRYTTLKVFVEGDVAVPAHPSGTPPTEQD